MSGRRHEPGREVELVRRVHVEEVFRRYDDVRQGSAEAHRLDRLEDGACRLERLAVAADRLPVEVCGGSAQAGADRLAPDQGEERERAERIGRDVGVRGVCDGIEQSLSEERLPVVREERLERLRTRLVLSDMKDQVGLAMAHGFLPQPMMRGGLKT